MCAGKKLGGGAGGMFLVLFWHKGLLFCGFQSIPTYSYVQYIYSTEPEDTEYVYVLVIEAC